MLVSQARVQGRNISDWESFHDEFDRVFGFPDFYGRNLDAWIDCMSYLDSEEAGMTSIHVLPGTTLGLVVEDAAYLKGGQASIYEAIVECAAAVNLRRAERELPPLVALTFHV